MKYSLVHMKLIMIALITIIFSSCNHDTESSTNIEPTSENIKPVNKNTSKNAVELDLNRNFVLVDSVKLVGTSSAPLFSTGKNVGFYGDKILIPDPDNNTVSLYHRDGSLVKKWGRGGSGPREFINPNWVSMDDQGRIYVREDYENYRVQVFDKDINLISTFPLNTRGPFNRSHIYQDSTGEYYYVTAGSVYCDESDAKPRCVMRKQKMNGDIVHKFAPMREIEPQYSGQPFVAGIYNEESVFIAHRNGNNVGVYSFETGDLEYMFNFDASKHVKLYGMETLPTHSIEARVKESRTRVHSFLRRINFYENLVVFDHGRRNYEEGFPNHFIDIYSLDGELLYYFEHEIPFEAVESGKFVFARMDDHLEYGGITFLEYTLSLEPVL